MSFDRVVRTLAGCVVAGSLLLWAQVAMASPGGVYGLQNCSCASGQSTSSPSGCKLCCRLGQRNGLDVTWLEDCEAFCDGVTNGPCSPDPCSWWNPFC